MFISEVRIENFRLFGSGENAFELKLKPGLTALVGENDAGKTAVVDAIRLVLGTRDREMLRLEESDFHHQPGGTIADHITIQIILKGLTVHDRAAFAEYLTYVPGGSDAETHLVLTWSAQRVAPGGASRRTPPPELRAGANGDGPVLDGVARSLLTATYLRPLRDAERAMGAGRNSRLSQILQHTNEITETGVPFDPDADPPIDPQSLSILGLGDYANFLFGESAAIEGARRKLNEEFLAPLAFASDQLNARISVSGHSDDTLRLRQLLEKLELALVPSGQADASHRRGLGSNNLLFMACELLLLAAESDGFPLLIVEEPEAHLHPQRQLRLMSFLQAQAKEERSDGQSIQILVTTHSPNLASEIRLENMVLIQGNRAFPMGQDYTLLSPSDYRFLERFLDVTKANLFFARAVLVVEGAAEELLLPAIARLLGRDFHHYGVSIVNVGGTGLSRYARVLMRQESEEYGEISVPVACITDLDVMPDEAPWIVGLLGAGEPVPEIKPRGRQWRIKSDFPDERLEERRKERRSKAAGQNVETFVANEWTLEYDLAFYGLDEQVWMAAHMALKEDQLLAGKTTEAVVAAACLRSLNELASEHEDREVYASHIYAKFEKDKASKAIAAQYMAEELEKLVRESNLSDAELREKLPPYIVRAIEHVTEPFVKGEGTVPSDNPEDSALLHPATAPAA